nr:PREDICTED: trafficking protein particle complex subunit 6B isoform X3 [Haliaeetus albicilla]
MKSKNSEISKRKGSLFGKQEQVLHVCSYVFTKDTARFKDELDIMKFICKDFWTTVFRKQIDNLRTNHQGIYVLQDNKFRLLTQMSAGKQYLEHAPKVNFR